MLNPRGYRQLPLHSNLVGWFAANKINNVNTALPSDGTSVSTWSDISGQGRLPTNSTATNQPTFKTNIANGQPAVLFDSNAGGANGDWLTLGTTTDIGKLSLTGATDWTIFICAKITAVTPPSGQSGTLLFNQGSGVSINEQYQFQQIPGGVLSITACAGDTGAVRTARAGNAIANTPFIVTAYSDTLGAARFYSKLNTGAFVTSDGIYPSILTTGSNFSIGRQKGGFTNRIFDGHIFEILIYNSQLTADERLVIERYLGTKYNIATA